MLAIARHGSTKANESAHIQGSSDVELSAIGYLQAKQLAVWAEGQGFEKVLSSPLARANETARIIAQSLNAPLFLCDELRERDYGRYEGLPIETLRRIRTEAGHKFIDPTQDWSGVEDVESDQAVYDRVSPIIISHYPFGSSHNVLCVTHAGTIKSVLYSVLGISPKRYNCIKVPTAAVVMLDYDTGGYLQLCGFFPLPQPTIRQTLL